MTICVPLGEVEKTADLAKSVEKAAGPVVVTEGGRKSFVSMPYDIFSCVEEELSRRELHEIVDRGLADMQAGHVNDAWAHAAGLKAQYGL